MRACLILAVITFAACSSDSTSPGPGPGRVPQVPTGLVSTSLDGAVALVWDDNAFAADPNAFQNYRVFSTSYSFGSDYLNGQCGTDWRLEGTSVAPEFVVGALTNGVAQCFAVSAISVDQLESARSGSRNDTPRPDARNVVIFARQVQASKSGFRFWNDLNGDGQVENNELGLVLSTSSEADFSVENSPAPIFFKPQRANTLIALYKKQPLEDLTSIDLAPDPNAPTGDPVLDYGAGGLDAAPGDGYVFRTDGPNGSTLFGAIRPTHVGTTFVIIDWAFQTDRDNPELRRGRKP
jgi:hypothetical protein